MLLLIFKIGADRYALPASQMIEVVPLVNLKKIPQAPPGVAGVFNYHGQPVPVIDLSELATGTPAQARVSTRIMLVNYSNASGPPLPAEPGVPHAADRRIYPAAATRGEELPGSLPTEVGVPRMAAARLSDTSAPATGSKHILGLMAEQTSETIRRGKADFMSAGVTVKTAPYLGSVLMDARGMVQCIEIERLLTESLRDLLFAPPAVSA